MKKQRPSLEILEYITLATSVAGSIVAVVSKELIYAVSPISLALVLNLINRQKYQQQTREIPQQLEQLSSAKKEWSEALKTLIEQLQYQAKTIDPKEYAKQVNSQPIIDLQNKQTALENTLVTLSQEIHNISQQFAHRPELTQIENLAQIILHLKQNIDRLPAPQDSQKTLKQLQQQVENALANIPAQVEAAGLSLVEEINQKLQTMEKSDDYEVVMKQEPSQILLQQTLENAQQQLILAYPWLRQKILNEIMIQKIESFLNNHGKLYIGWDGDTKNQTLFQLQKIAQQHPGQIEFKQIESHENFIVCDDIFAWVGSHNVLSANNTKEEKEIGIRTTDRRIIQELIERIQQAPRLEISQQSTVNSHQ